MDYLDQTRSFAVNAIDGKALARAKVLVHHRVVIRREGHPQHGWDALSGGPGQRQLAAVLSGFGKLIDRLEFHGAVPE